jgi:hypothetical protein
MALPEYAEPAQIRRLTDDEPIPGDTMMAWKNYSGGLRIRCPIRPLRRSFREASRSFREANTHLPLH